MGPRPGIAHILLIALMLCASTSAPAAQYSPDGDIVGADATHRVARGENISAIARRFDVGFDEIIAANPASRRARIKSGQVLAIPDAHILPSVREGIVLDVARLRLFYFEQDSVFSYPISIGKQGWNTPTGKTVITRKRKDPVWYPPSSIRLEDPTLPEFVPAGPENPLGSFALNLGWPGYAIHGTNNPSSIGKRVSHGCIRLYPEDIADLFARAPLGTKVTVVNEPLRLGWRAGSLYLEASPTLPRIPSSQVFAEVLAFAGPETAIDWAAVRDAVRQRTGTPVRIGRQDQGSRASFD